TARAIMPRRTDSDWCSCMDRITPGLSARFSHLIISHRHRSRAVTSRFGRSSMRHIEAGRWDEVASMLLDSAEKLRLAGADLLICRDNTVHEAIDLIRDQSPLTWLHIAEEVAAAATERNFVHLLILGTKYLM